MILLKRQYPVTILLLLAAVTSCQSNRNSTDPDENINFRQEMRDFVSAISDYAKNTDPDFLIIPQNGQELITDTGEADGQPDQDYLDKIDGTGRESMFYGYYQDNQATPAEDEEHLLALCQLCEQNGVEVLATDYCSTPSKMDDSYQTNAGYGFISFAADDRELSTVPAYPAGPYLQNGANISTPGQAKNFLYLINPEHYAAKADFIRTMAATDYDLLIIDFFHTDSALTNADIDQLRNKASGGQRLVICYLSIGEAEDYRYYWQSSWKKNRPEWLEPENPDWPGNYKVKYWHPDWQQIIFGHPEAYLDRIISAGFDGVYLDIIDGFEYFEEK